jgi:uncharacterized protein (TIGR02099 family)
MIVLLAAYVSLGRYYIQYVEQYQQELLDNFAESTGLKIKAGSMYARWSELSPVLVLDDFSLFLSEEPEDAIFSLTSLELKLDVFTSVSRQTVQINRMAMRGVNINLEEVSPGQWAIKGLPESSGETDVDDLIDLILSIDAIDVSELEVGLNFYNKTRALLTGKELLLEHDKDFRRIKAAVKFNDAEKLLHIIVETEGDPRDTEDFTAQAYVKFDDIDLTPHLPVFQSLGVELEKASLDGEVWVLWSGERQSLQVNLATPYLDLAALSGTDLPPLEGLQFSLLAERSPEQGTRIWLSDIMASWYEQDFKFEQLAFSDDQGAYIFSLPKLDIDSTLKKLAVTGIIKEKEQKIINTLSPKGQLSNAQLLLTREESGASFQFRANLEGVSIQSWKGTPEASHIDGYLQMSAKKGVVELDAKQFTIGFPGIYKNAMNFDAAKGRVKWRIDQEKKRVLVNSGVIELEAEEGNASGLLLLDIPMVAKDPNPPTMDLMVGLKNAQASYRSKYIPSLVLSDGLVTWLDQSIKGGQVSDGGFVFRGSLRKADTANRSVQLHLNITEAVLDYHPEWPRVENATAELFLDDYNLDVFASEAIVHGLSVTNAVVKLQKKAGVSWLSIKSDALGSGVDALGLLNDSAIREITGGVLEPWVLEGEVNAIVDLNIPINSVGVKPDIQVVANFKDNKLNLQDLRLKFDRVSGTLRYTSEKGLEASGLSGYFFGKKSKVDIKQDAVNGLVISANGKIDMRDVQEWTSQTVLMFVHGTTDFQVVAHIKPDERILSIRSDMQGVSIDLPPPYNKRADEKQLLDLSLKIDQPSLLEFTLAEHVSVQLEFDQQSFKSGLVVLGEGKTVSREENRIIVTGYAPVVRLDQWQPVFDRYVAEESKQSRDGDAKSVDVVVENLFINDLNVFDIKFKNAYFGVQEKLTGWDFSLKNKMLDGHFLLANDRKKPFSLLLDKLVLESMPNEDRSEESIRNFEFVEEALHGVGDVEPEEKAFLATIDPSALNDADVVIKQLYVDDELYGDLSFNLRSDERGLRLENLLGEIRHLRIGSKEQPAYLFWSVNEGMNQSGFRGRLSFDNLAGVLERWNYEAAIESESGFIDLSLVWPDRPDNWSLSSLEGRVSVGVEDGLFRNTSKAASGALKVVGILNLTNILRRLQLDFSDIYKGGVSFDEIDGEFELAAGQLSIIDSLKIDSPSSSFYISGDTDLNTELLDMELVATLPIASNLPWVAALIGGLPVAAGVYVAGKIFEKQMDKLSSAKYEMNGTWSEPELNFRSIFNDDKKKSKVRKNKKLKEDDPFKLKTVEKKEPVLEGVSP